ncbi:MAG: hypothetical protein AB1749_04750 [Pseudomonadota bacterium]
MTDINYALGLDGSPDDLPRTVRREKEARERELREREAAVETAPQGPSLSTTTLAPDYEGHGPAYRGALDQPPVAAAVTRLDIPFPRLVAFFLKAVFAAIPALVLLGGLLWAAGHLLRVYFPELVKMQILIYFPN